MPLLDKTYPISPKGLATSFVETEMPPDYAISLRNRFMNTAGGAEMRQGMIQSGATVPGAPNLTSIHFLVKPNGTEVEFVAGDGSLYRKDSAALWTVVRTGINTTNRLHSVQFDDKLIFENGVDRNFYTTDGVTFKELIALIAEGTMTQVSGNAFEDSNVSDWVGRGARANDLVENVTRSTYGFITAIVTAQASVASAAALARIVHVPMGASGNGLASGINNSTGDIYRIWDLVELNVAPTDGEPDNTGTFVGLTSAAGFNVSGMTNWPGTEARVGDWAYNTTRQSVAQMIALTSGHVTHTAVSAQVTGDSVILMKSAMPISTHLHTHFGHLFHIDARDRRKIRISGPGDPQDMTNGATLDSSTFKFGSLQPQGDYAVAMGSFQRFFVIGGKKYVFLYSGINPLDTDGFTPVGLFPQGIAAEDALLSIGNDATFLTPDGLQSVSLVGDASTLNRANISEAIRVTIREELTTTAEQDIKLFHYPRRSWLMVKIGARLYVFNYTAYVGQGTPKPGGGSWSIFDGKFATQNDYAIRLDGTLICCGPGGKVFEFDQGTYDDDGETYSTEFESAHLKPQGDNVNIIRHEYLKPIIKVGSNIQYTVEIEGNYDGAQSNDSITIPTSAGAAVGNAVVGTAVIGGSTTVNDKYPLRARGEAVKVRITTPGGAGPDVLARFTSYFSPHGKQ